MSSPATTAPETGALYNRYRPATLAEVVGQDQVTVPLRNALEKGKAHHAYLLSGPAGCGKTSTARILAKAMLCDASPVADPCGQCGPCQAMASQTCVDYIEIDAASKGSVEDARDLREKVAFAPVQAGVKVIVIDEAHMVTQQAFNALLKVVEEPPPHVRFIFATTEPDKVISTIRSRTFNYRFRLVPPAILAEHVTRVVTAEGGSLEDGVLPLLLRAGGGSVRTTLSLLSQLLDGSFGGRISREETAALLGSTSDEVLDQMIAALADRDTAAMLRALGAGIDEGAEPKRLGEDLLDRLRDLLLLAVTGQVPPLAEIAGPTRVAAWQDAASRLGVRGLTSSAEALQAALLALPGGAAARIGLEVACARMQIGLADTVDLPGMVTRLEAALASGGTFTVTTAPAPTPAPAPVVVAAPVSVGSERVAEYKDNAARRMREAGEDPDRPVSAATPDAAPVAPVAAEPVDEWAPPADLPAAEAPVENDPWAPPADTDPMADAPTPVAAPTATPVAASGTPDAGAWDRVLAGILAQPRGRTAHTLLSGNATVGTLDDGQIVLRFANAALAKAAVSGGHLNTCAAAAAAVLGGTWTVSVEGAR